MNKKIISIGSALVFLGFSTLVCLAADYYGDDHDFELRSDEERYMEVLGEIMPGYRGRELEIDLGLVKAARAVADHLGSTSGLSHKGIRISSDLVRKEVREAGVADQRLFFNYTLYQPGSDLRLYLENNVKAMAGRDPFTHMGIGVSGREVSKPTLVVILSERMVEFDPFPTRVSVGGEEDLRARLVGPGKGLKARVLLTSPSGKVMKAPMLKDGEGFFSLIPFKYGAGTYRLEITVSGSSQAAVAAIMEVKATGSETESDTDDGVFKIDFEDKIYYNPVDAEADVIKMVNQVRRRSGLKPLNSHPKLTDMAREHAKDMMENEYVGHFSQDRGSIEQRAARAGIQSEVLENVAVNSSVKAAVEGLLESPAHRKHIINPKFNRTGVGVAIDHKGGQNWYYVAQEFAAIP